MRYMTLIYNEGGAQAWNRDECFAYIQEMRDSGYYEGGDPLQDTNVATSVSVRDGKTIAKDGPFSETKEQLAGYFILNCPNLDVAIECAAKIPGAKLGTVEIRPLLEIQKL